MLLHARAVRWISQRVRRCCGRSWAISIQGPQSLLQDSADVLGMIGADHAGIEIEIETSHVLTKDLDLFAGSAERASNSGGNDFATDPRHHDGWRRLRDHNVSHQHIALT